MNSASALVHKRGLRLFIDRDLLGQGINAVFTTRVGGLSKPPFDSLNLALHTNDSPHVVHDNRRLLCQALGLDPSTLTFANQVHGREVARVDKTLVGAQGSPDTPALPAADGLFTNLSGVNLAILTADCLPVILADPAIKLVAAIHAGWRGTLQGILVNAVSLMVKAGARPARIQARFGPAVGPCCYEVGRDLYDRFADRFALPVGQKNPRLDLAKLNEDTLTDAGLKERNIRKIDYCTACHPDLFYSWRREHITGRQAALVGVCD